MFNEVILPYRMDYSRHILRLLITSLLGIFLAVLYLHSEYFKGLVFSALGFRAEGQQCHTPPYSVHVLSYYPLILHIGGFLSDKERSHLLQLAEPRYARSEVELSERSELRTSTTAFLPREDPVARCIMERAAEFQGFTPVENVERLQATRYAAGQQFLDHVDWIDDPDKAKEEGNRVTTFFAILEANCTGCGTRFPRLSYDWKLEDARICEYVNCSSDTMEVRPLPGSAVFWVNLLEDGSGNEKTVHAGLPLVDGVKTGLNIWTWNRKRW